MIAYICFQKTRGKNVKLLQFETKMLSMREQVLRSKRVGFNIVGVNAYLRAHIIVKGRSLVIIRCSHHTKVEISRDYQIISIGIDI